MTAPPLSPLLDAALAEVDASRFTTRYSTIVGSHVHEVIVTEKSGGVGAERAHIFVVFHGDGGPCVEGHFFLLHSQLPNRVKPVISGEANVAEMLCTFFSNTHGG